jgi:hypothetical protein
MASRCVHFERRRSRSRSPHAGIQNEIASVVVKGNCKARPPKNLMFRGFERSPSCSIAYGGINRLSSQRGEK